MMLLFQGEEDEDFLSICRAMEEIVDDPIDCYWLIKCFVNQFHTKFGDSVPHLVSVTWSTSILLMFRSCLNFERVVVVAAKEPGTLSESGGTSTAEPSEEQRRSSSASIRPVVQALFCWLPA